jgi:hypothetical protein
VRKFNQTGINVGRRDFIKTTTMASMAATLPETTLPGQDTGSLLKSGSDRMKKNLLFLTDSPATFQKFRESIQAIKEADFIVSPITVNYQKPQEVIQSIRGKDADILLMCLPVSAFSYGNLSESLGDLGVPILLLAQNPELILIDVNFAAALRIKNSASVLFATSETQAIEMLKAVGLPRILEGKRAILYGKPFDSTSSPAHNLNEDYVYRRTGVRMQYRPMGELKQLFDRTDEASARKEAERWKKEAVAVVEPSDKTILDACRLYVLLRSIIEKEGLSAISIDCLGFLFNRNLALPYPCLAFARLRDEGITAACEADVCGMLSSMFFQEISRKPSFISNVLSVDLPHSSTVLSHCVAPLKMMGPNTSSLPYKLRDYHGMGQGVVPEVEFPVGIEVLTGAFSKDLKSFLLWPGRNQVGMKTDTHTEKPSFPSGFRRMTCSNYVELKIRDADRYLQNIAGIHHIMIAGSYSKAMKDALLSMNVSIIGPSDFTAPQLD